MPLILHDYSHSITLTHNRMSMFTRMITSSLFFSLLTIMLVGQGNDCSLSILDQFTVEYSFDGSATYTVLQNWDAADTQDELLSSSHSLNIPEGIDKIKLRIVNRVIPVLIICMLTT